VKGGSKSGVDYGFKRRQDGGEPSGSLLLSATRISRVNGARGRWVINHSAPTVPSWAAPRDEAVSALLLLSLVPKLTFPFYPRKFRHRKRADYRAICLRLPTQGYRFLVLELFPFFVENVATEDNSISLCQYDGALHTFDRKFRDA